MLDCTLVFYEAPHRFLRLSRTSRKSRRSRNRPHPGTDQASRGIPPRDALALFRNLQERESVKGEITLIIGKPVAKPDERPVREAFEAYIAQGLSRMDAIKAVAKDRGVSKREIYAALEC